MKKDTATVSAQSKPEAEVEIAPIVGRKKKQKKEKTVSSNATPVGSRPQTPVQQALPPPLPALLTKDTKQPAKEESSTYRSTAHETTTLLEEEPARGNKAGDSKGKGKEVANSDDSSPTTSKPVSSNFESQPGPGATWVDLQEAGFFADGLDNLAFAGPLVGLNDRYKHDPSIPNNAAAKDMNKDVAAPIPTKSIVTEDDQATLLSGKPVRKVVDGVRILLTPNGDCVRHLTEEEEDRFLELQSQVAQSAAQPSAFVSPRHEPAGGFSLIKGRAVPNGPPGYFPRAPSAYPSDPVGKIQREEAIYYINQYVLPRLNLSTINLEFPGPWKTPLPDGKVNMSSLNTYAPWIYRGCPNGHPDDTAAPELNYPSPAGVGLGNPQGLASVLEITANGVLGPGADATAASVGSGTSAGKAGGAMVPSPFSSVPLMSLEDAEQGLAVARKETEKLEKSLNQLIKRNRRLLMINPGGGSH